MSSQLLSRSAVAAIVLALVFLTVWELHWRSEGYPASPDDNRHLWAEQRAKVNALDSGDFILIGSSRVFFDIQLDEWEQVTGKRPIQLAIAGGTPTPVFQDIVDNSDFNGTIIFGVTPPLFFMGAQPGIDFWDHPASWVEHYHTRTYADRWNHLVGKPAQYTLACLENDEDVFYNDLDLRTLINRIPLKGRVPEMPPFPWFQYVDKDRNITMLEKVTQDTAYAGMIKRTWQFFITGGPPPDSAMVFGAKAAVMDMTMTYLERFRERGGNVVFIRCPSNDWFREIENMAVPRALFWDDLIRSTGAPGYHFEDYDFMSKYECPEWSHLDSPDARQFTLDVASQMLKDGALR